MIIPRFYQIKAVDTILQRFEKGVTRPVLSLATGLGKTICFGLLAKKLDTRTLILAHRSELLEQASEKISLVWPSIAQDIGILKAERNEIDKKIVIASVQSACRPSRLQQLKEQSFNLCVVDECHHATADSYQSVIRELGFMEGDPSRLLLGVTATVGRGDGKSLSAVFQEIVFKMGVREGIEQGYLSPLIGRQIFSKVDLKGVGTSCGDFNIGELSSAVNTPSRNALIVDSYLKHAQDRQRTIAFCVDIKHGEDLAIAFREKGITSTSVSGLMDDDERRQTLKDFSNGKYRVLCNCMILVEGYDESAVDCLLMARPTQSESLFVQMTGRAVRLHPGKNNALLLDFVDNSARHKLCSICNSLEGVVKVLERVNKNETKEIKKKDEKEDPEVTYSGEREIAFFDTREFSWTKTGDHWHLGISLDQEVWVKKVGEDQFEVIARDGEKTIQISEQLLPLLYATGAGEDWARRQEKWGSARKDARWRTEPATPKQLDTLTKFGFNYDVNISKGEAFQLLEARFKEPATDRQISWLRSHHVDFPRAITKLQAKKLIAEKICKK